MAAEQQLALEPVIRLRGVTKTFGEGAAAFLALRGVDLDVAAGDFVAVLAVGLVAR